MVVKPSQLPPPTLIRQPQIIEKDGILTLDYILNLNGRRDESRITWYRNGVPVSVTHMSPKRSFLLSEVDNGCKIMARIEPKHQRSDYGPGCNVSIYPKYKAKVQTDLFTNFHDFPCQWQPNVIAGFWTIDGHKPQDTVNYQWSFDSGKPMWTYEEGFNGAVGMGLLQAQRGARLMYTPIKRNYGDMHLTLCVDPTKTAGQGFGSATGQYMDVCLKFDTKTLTGYGLRIIRTTKHAKAVDFLLVKYENGAVSPVSESVSATCYRTNCTISVDFIGNMLTANVVTDTPKPKASLLPHCVELQAEVEPNDFGGIHIQHTGSCGESTTMLHSLKVRWL